MMVVGVLLFRRIDAPSAAKQVSGKRLIFRETKRS